MVSRRNFLKAIAAGAVVYPFKKAFGYQKERRLFMRNIHTEEILDVKYYSSGTYDIGALSEINYFLRCHYTNEVKAIDVELLDLLCDIKDRFGKDNEIIVISGYRSLAYNEYLRSIGRRVSKNSLHLKGLAIDFTIPGISNQEIASAARSFAMGGIGIYSEFVHIDTGRVRYW